MQLKAAAKKRHGGLKQKQTPHVSNNYCMIVINGLLGFFYIGADTYQVYIREIPFSEVQARSVDLVICPKARACTHNTRQMLDS